VNICSICLSDQRVRVDQMVNDHRSTRSIEKATGLDYQSLGRHRRGGHVAPPAQSAPTGTGVPNPTGPYSPLDGLRADLAILNAMDPSTMSSSAAMALFSERRRLNEAVARLDPPVVVEPETPTVGAFLRLLDEVIERHPEERDRFMAAWRAYRGDAPARERDYGAERKYRRDEEGQ
jgi:hypothetical protein